jgi:hypothetical protein
MDTALMHRQQEATPKKSNGRNRGENRMIIPGDEEKMPTRLQLFSFATGSRAGMEAM